jgi:hypothetical protein
MLPTFLLYTINCKLNGAVLIAIIEFKGLIWYHKTDNIILKTEE